MTDTRPPVSPTPATEEKIAEDQAASAGDTGAASPAAAAAPPPAGSGWRPPTLSRRATLVIGLLAIAGIAAVLAAWRIWPFTTPYESTDNAYVRGRTTVIAPQVSGYVTQVLVRDFETVTAGQPLVVIDQRIYRQRVDQAQAQVENAQATLANSRQSQASRQASFGAQEAAVANAQAQLMRAQADMALLVSAHDERPHIAPLLYQTALQHLLDLIFVLLCDAREQRLAAVNTNLERMQEILSP